MPPILARAGWRGCAMSAALLAGMPVGTASQQSSAAQQFPVAQQSPAAQPSSPAAVTGRSLILPGWGQLALGQRRGWAYVAAEALLWGVWVDRRAAAHHAAAGYRDLAWSTARDGVSPRLDGDWAYYEAMSKWTRSGAFDSDPSTSGVQPEGDPSTFNGSIWRLARDVYFPSGTSPGPGDPVYEDALAYYRKRAYGTDFVWDWSGRDPALHEYKALIDRSDARFRQATTALGVVLANHLLSAVDAYLSSSAPAHPRLRLAPGDGAGTPGMATWSLHLRMDAPW